MATGHSGTVSSARTSMLNQGPREAETVEDEDEVDRPEVVAVGHARIPQIGEPRTATHHSILSGILILSPVVFMVGIGLEQAARPLQNVAGHILDMIRTRAVGVTTTGVAVLMPLSRVLQHILSNVSPYG